MRAAARGGALGTPGEVSRVRAVRSVRGTSYLCDRRTLSRAGSACIRRGRHHSCSDKWGRAGSAFVVVIAGRAFARIGVTLTDLASSTLSERRSAYSVMTKSSIIRSLAQMQRGCHSAGCANCRAGHPRRCTGTYGETTMWSAKMAPRSRSASNSRGEFCPALLLLLAVIRIRTRPCHPTACRIRDKLDPPGRAASDR